MRAKTLLKLGLCAAALQLGVAAVSADDQSPWLVRGRIINVSPDESSTTSIGGSVTAGDSFQPELDISYFWSKNFATELILATSKHEIGAVDTALNDLDLGSVWALPPTLLAQYHFNPEGRVRPYVGVGLNYTIFHSAKSGDVDTIEYENGFGYAFQAGADIGIDDHWAFNLDVKKLYLNTKASINGGAVTADVDLDPWVFGAGIAYRF